LETWALHVAAPPPRRRRLAAQRHQALDVGVQLVQPQPQGCLNLGVQRIVLAGHVLFQAEQARTEILFAVHRVTVIEQTQHLIHAERAIRTTLQSAELKHVLRKLIHLLRQDFGKVILLRIPREVMELKRPKIVVGRGRAAVEIAGDVGSEAEVLRQIPIPAQMPLAHAGSPVAFFLQQ